MRRISGLLAATLMAAVLLAGPGLALADIEKAEVGIIGGMQCSL